MQRERPLAAGKAAVAWHPSTPRVGDVAWILVKDVTDTATVEGSVDGKPLSFFPYASGQAALFGVDLETKPGAHAWRVGVVEPGREPRSAQGTVKIVRRDFRVQRLTLPNTMVDLDPETERRALAESKQTGDALPDHHARANLAGEASRRRSVRQGPGTGFGARRIINGQPRSPHSGSDYSAPRGTPVVAVNAGKVALVAEFFFPGRLVILTTGSGSTPPTSTSTRSRSLTVSASSAAKPWGRWERRGGLPGPHLHFGAQVAGARIDPTTLLGLSLID